MRNKCANSAPFPFSSAPLLSLLLPSFIFPPFVHSSALVRLVRIVRLVPLRLFRHDVLKLGPEPFHLTELVADLQYRDTISPKNKIGKRRASFYSNHSFETSIELVDILEYVFHALVLGAIVHLGHTSR